MKSLIGRREICMKSLSIAPDHPLEISERKIEKLKCTLSERVDPTLLTFTVYLADPTSFDANNREKMAEQSYYVISGVHMFLAMEALPEFSDETKLTCWILFDKNETVDTAPLRYYAGVRNNELASVCQRAPYLHEIVLVLISLIKNLTKEKAFKTIDRYSKLMKMPPGDRLCLQRFSDWDKSNINNLELMIKAYERLDTSDALKIMKKKKHLNDHIEVHKKVS